MLRGQDRLREMLATVGRRTGVTQMKVRDAAKALADLVAMGAEDADVFVKIDGEKYRVDAIATPGFDVTVLAR